MVLAEESECESGAENESERDREEDDDDSDDDLEIVGKIVENGKYEIPTFFIIFW